jgi:hypothetical protein
MGILAMNHLLFQPLRSTQAGLNTRGEHFLDRNALLDSTRLRFLKKRVGQVKARSHRLRKQRTNNNAEMTTGFSKTSILDRPRFHWKIGAVRRRWNGLAV